MKNAIYKNKALGVCALLFAVSIALPQLAKAEGEYTYSRDPSGSGEYQNVDVSFSTADIQLLDFYISSPDANLWNACGLVLDNGNTQYIVVTFPIGEGSDREYTFDETQNFSYEDTGDFNTLDVIFFCEQSGTENNNTMILEGNTSDVIFSLGQTEEETTYSGMFGTSGGTELTGNISNFIGGSGIMNIVLIFLGCIVSFLIIYRVIEVAKIKQEKEEKEEKIKEEKDEEENPKTKKGKYWEREEKKYNENHEILTKENAKHFSKATGRNLEKFVDPKTGKYSGL
jgi:hypothetical protein